MRKPTKAQWRAAGIEPPRTAAQIRAEYRKKAKALTVETKRIFWQAWLDGENLGAAASLAEIDDISVAAELHAQCYEKITYYRPKTIYEIK